MVVYQRVEISWTKEARGGQLASVRNAVPIVYTLSDDEKREYLNNAIWYRVRVRQLADAELYKMDWLLPGYTYELTDNELVVKQSKGNGHFRKVAALQQGESCQLVHFYKLISIEYHTSYHRVVLNLFFGESAPIDNYFLQNPFKIVYP